MKITAHSTILNKTIEATGSEPELKGDDHHITTQLGHWCDRMNSELYLGAADWLATVALPGPLHTA
jgi:hypothetical protein